MWLFDLLTFSTFIILLHWGKQRLDDSSKCHFLNLVREDFFFFWNLHALWVHCKESLFKYRHCSICFPLSPSQAFSMTLKYQTDVNSGVIEQGETQSGRQYSIPEFNLGWKVSDSVDCQRNLFLAVWFFWKKPDCMNRNILFCRQTQNLSNCTRDGTQRFNLHHNTIINLLSFQEMSFQNC